MNFLGQGLGGLDSRVLIAKSLNVSFLLIQKNLTRIPKNGPDISDFLLPYNG